MTESTLFRAVFAVASSAFIAGATLAQCPNPSWLPGHGHAGADLTPTCATVWDHDKNPATPKWLVVGGSFWYVGTVQGDGVAAWDPATGQWHQLGEGPQTQPGEYPECLGVLGDGTLVVGGWIPGHVAAWNGSTWETLGGGMDGIVNGFANANNGDLIAVGSFTTAGSVSVTNMARWNGTAWTEVAPGIEVGIDWSQGSASDVAVLPNGNIIVAGGQQLTPGIYQYISRWDGTQWRAMGDAPDFDVLDMDVAPNGDLYVGGGFTQIGGVQASRVAKWNGTAWSTLGSGINTGIPIGEAYVNSVKVMPNGTFYAGGDIITAGGLAAPIVAKWNGSQWSSTNTGWPPVYTSVRFIERLDDNSIVINSDTLHHGGVPTGNLARYNGSQWSGLNKGFDYWIWGFGTLADGRVVAGGLFNSTPDVQSNLAAIWNGSTWQAMPGLLFNGWVQTITELNDGRILAGGSRVFYDPTLTNTLTEAAVYNGTTWKGLDVFGYVDSSMKTANGDIVIGGGFLEFEGVPVNNIVRWNGASTFTPIGNGIGDDITGARVTSLLELPNGDIIAGGEFTTVENGAVTANYLAIWNGTAWAEFAGGADGAVFCLRRLNNGDILASGFFTTIGGVSANGIARWNGSQWSSLGNEPTYPVLNVLQAPNGDIIAGGQFEFQDAQGNTVRSIGRWDGTAWHAIGEGITGRPGSQPGDLAVVNALAFGPSGELMAGGSFFMAGTQPSTHFARYGCEAPTCYPDCDQSGELNIDDFICFQTFFAIGDSYADCDQSGDLNIDDFICFQTSFAIGC